MADASREMVLSKMVFQDGHLTSAPVEVAILIGKVDAEDRVDRKVRLTFSDYRLPNGWSGTLPPEPTVTVLFDEQSWEICNAGHTRRWPAIQANDVVAVGVDAKTLTDLRSPYLHGQALMRWPMADIDGVFLPQGYRPTVNRFGAAKEKIVVPFVFPVAGGASWTDTWQAPRRGHLHAGQDLMGPRGVPLVACFDGTVAMPAWGTPMDRSQGFRLSLDSGGAFSAEYWHLNDDTPGTNDGRADPTFAYAPGIRDGVRVEKGQLLGWLGNSGNAEATLPHLHIELYGKYDKDDHAVYNLAPTLRTAKRISAPIVPLAKLDDPIPTGAVRVDGMCQSVDPRSHVLNIVRSSQVANGKQTVATRATIERVPLPGPEVRSRLLPNGNVPIQNVRPGDGVTVIKTSNGKSTVYVAHLPWALEPDLMHVNTVRNK